MEKIGLIGTGVMGLTVAKKLLKSGYHIVAYDANSGALKNAERIGAEVADSPAHLAKTMDIILMFLPGPAEVEIINLKGVTLQTTTISGNSGQVNIDCLPNGIYLIRISTRSGIVVQKFIKN